MSPVAPSSGHATKALFFTFLVIAIGMAALWGASSLLTNRHNNRADTRTVGGVVDLGQASRLAKQLQESGGIPVFWPDVSGNNARDVYLTHRPGSLNSGWSAFLAQVPEKPSSCLWEWNRTTNRFDATCHRSLHADRHGSELTQYPVTVEKGRLKVDLTVKPATPTTHP